MIAAYRALLWWWHVSLRSGFRAWVGAGLEESLYGFASKYFRSFIILGRMAHSRIY